MRRITGYFAGVECVILEYGRGIVECPSLLLKQLVNTDGALPTGDALVAKCRAVLTEPISIKESEA